MSPVLARTAATVAVLVGATFFLQGVGFLPGSVMTGSPVWAVIGAVLLVAGIVVWRRFGHRRFDYR